MPIPYHGREFTFSQPDGKEIKLTIWGNQFYAVFEDIEGFTIIKDPETGYYQYAKLSTDKSQFESTKVNVGESDPNTLGLSKHLRITKEQSKIKSLETYQKLGSKPRWQERRERHRSKQLKAMKEVGTFTAPPSEQRKGKYVGLCILIQFPDVKGTIQQSEVENYCNKNGYSGFGNQGSVHDYFWDVSRGKLDYTNIITYYYTAKKNRAYYTDQNIQYGVRAQELINEALVDLKNKGFDFSKLTVDDEGYVYALNAFYAGSCPNDWAKGLWPHSSGLNTSFNIGNNKKIRDYQITNMGDELSIGTFCHENGHMVCDFPDLYDYGYESCGDGIFCLMAFGNADKNPVKICAYLKYKVGWAEKITQITEGMYKADSISNDFYIYSKNPVEYFIIENRFKEKRDNTLPVSGLAIWHVDETGSNNDQDRTSTKHYECSLIQPDNKFDLERGNNIGDAGDLYSSPTYSKFNVTTSPNSKWWDGTPSGLDLVDIGQPNQQISFKSIKSGGEKMVIVIAHMEEAGTQVKDFIEKKGRLPSYVSCICYDNMVSNTPQTVNITMPQFLYAATALFGSDGSAEIINVNPASSPSGKFKSGKILESEYRTMAESIKNFIETNGRAPNFANSTLGQLPFKTLISLYSKIWAFMGKNHRTPTNVTLEGNS